MRSIWRLSLPALCAASLAAVALPRPLRAQHTDHAAHQAAAKRDTSAAKRDTAATRTATLPGQDAFGAIAEIVKILKADPATDWSKVNLEALRQHLIDMHEVTLNAVVRSEEAPGGLWLTVTGQARTRDAIQRMIGAHGHMLMMEGLEGEAEPIADGMRWRVTTRDPKRVAELRGLGFIGIMTLGDHHTAHHVQLARGANPH